MKEELSPDAVLAAVDGILEQPLKPAEAKSKWLKLDRMLDKLQAAVKVDPKRHRHLLKVLSSLRSAASELTRSISNAKRGGPVRDDWMRLAQEDLIKLKDELLALREFIIKEMDFLRLACLRAQLEDLEKINPEKLFQELHEAEAISERTWVLLMTHPESRKAARDRDLSKQLINISKWLLELEELRRETSADLQAKR